MGYEWFPFLIGRIRTEFAAFLGYLVNAEFPFLIGRIRTLEIQSVRMEEEMFPFLIGRIRTEVHFEADYEKNSFHSS